MGEINRVYRLSLLLAWLTLGALLCGCSSAASPRPALPEAVATVQDSPLPTLPSPAVLTRTASAWNYAECHGADYLTDVIHNRVATKATLAGFSPLWRLGEHHPLDEAAYAVYALQVPSFAGVNKVSLVWLGLPPAARTCWIGLANQLQDRWDWLLLGPDGTVQPPSLVPYSSSTQQMFIAVVLLGDEPRSLNALWVGDGTHLYYEVEDNDSAEEANPLPPLPFKHAELTGSLGTDYLDCYDGDVADWFTFFVDEPAKIKLSFRHSGTYGSLVYFKLHQADATKQLQLISQGSNDGDKLLVCPSAGQYWLELTSDTRGALYGFTLEPCEEKFTEVEDNDSYQQANPVATSDAGYLPVSGCLSAPRDATEDVYVYDGDHDDWFSFNIQSVPRITINLIAHTASRGFAAELYAADGITLLDSVNVNYYSDVQWNIRLPALGKYYLRLYCVKEADYVSYSFSIISNADNHGWFNWRIDQGTPLDQSLFANISEMVSFDTDKRPELCWRNTEDNALYYSLAEDESFTRWSKPQLITTCPSNSWKIETSLIVDSRPAIVCHNSDKTATGAPQYYYLIAKDRSGEVWNDPVGIKITNIDSFDALAFVQVQGSPALIGIYGFYSGGYDYRGGVFYSRAEDALGTGWSAPNPIDTVWNTTAYCSMQIINGKPAVAISCYYDSIYCYVRYAQAEDELGNAWAQPVTLYDYINPDRVVLLNWFTAPVIYIKPQWTNYLPRGWFVQAMDADGLTWNAPYDTNLLLNDSDYETDTIFALVNSVPRAVWASGRVLMYSFAEEYDGSKWAYAEAVDPIATSKEYLYHCLFDLKGQLGIAYIRDGLRLALRY